eukprot:CAMPEP_0171300502 /NCGR_PEP_ID=MMETSP0816-20121228/9312_1 /TAXON_ID=420281 /ORGANISM="Proboscia inermis, Strain CCAP1064/1" /LENGTH=198 /DNA_ID=CAMNT_0011777029 /DNA_START=182 /DNA_END=775 /DNA_ORIENTATION=+
MIKQWNSIKGVWDLMRQNEVRLLMEQRLNIPAGENDNNDYSQRHYYDQVGLFRSDVFYTKHIDIFDANAALPNFHHFTGYNDRLFYGKYDYAKLWANRFDFVDIFDKKYMFHFKKKQMFQGNKMIFPTKHPSLMKLGYHSERFVKKLLNHYNVTVELKNICVWRVRSGPRFIVNDCKEMKKFSTLKAVSEHLPPELDI